VKRKNYHLANLNENSILKKSEKSLLKGNPRSSEGGEVNFRIGASKGGDFYYDSSSDARSRD